MLLYRNLRSRRTTEEAKGEEDYSDILGQSSSHHFQNVAEIGEGAYNEMNGVSRPPELHGMPRVELN